MSNRIQQIALQQNIPYLCHFTHISNVPTILKYGICSVDLLNECGMPYKRNDALRIDGYTNFNCLSISFPNDVLFDASIHFKINNSIF